MHNDRRHLTETLVSQIKTILLTDLVLDSWPSDEVEDPESLVGYGTPQTILDADGVTITYHPPVPGTAEMATPGEEEKGNQ